MKNCIMFVCHQANDFIKHQIAKILNDIKNTDEYDLWILFNSEKGEVTSKNLNIYTFNIKKCENLGLHFHKYYFNHPMGFYGHNMEYSFMSFYKEHPKYNFYWLIEYDVYNTGNWYDLFSYYDKNHKDVDLYTTHINYDLGDWQTTWKPIADYLWIKSFNLTNNIKCKCFNPIDRFSNKALSILCDSYEKGDYGFFEIAMPTIFINNGLTLKVFGKTTEYNKDNRFVDDFSDEHFEFINDETVQFEHKYRYKSELEEGKIYHPIKTFLIE